MPLPKKTTMAFKSISHVQLPTSFSMTCYWLPRIRKLKFKVTTPAGREDTMGQQGRGTINDNGEGLVEFCLKNSWKWVVRLCGSPTETSTNWLSWRYPNGNTVNQIDRFIVNKGQTIIFLEGGGDEKYGGKRLQVLKRQNKLFASTICVKKCLRRSQISH